MSTYTFIPASLSAGGSVPECNLPPNLPLNSGFYPREMPRSGRRGSLHFQTLWGFLHFHYIIYTYIAYLGRVVLYRV